MVCNRLALRSLALALVLGLSASWAAPPARAGVIVNIYQAGPDVVAAVSGSLDLTSMIFLGSGSISAQIAPSAAILLTGSGNYWVYTGISGLGSWGPGGITFASSSSGDRFGIVGAFAQMVVPVGYVSGSPIASTATWSGATIAGLGLTVGTYSYTLPTDTITVHVGTAPIPEPGCLALAAVAAGTAGARRLLRRRGAAGQI